MASTAITVLICRLVDLGLWPLRNPGYRAGPRFGTRRLAFAEGKLTCVHPRTPPRRVELLCLFDFHDFASLVIAALRADAMGHLFSWQFGHSDAECVVR